MVRAFKFYAGSNPTLSPKKNRFHVKDLYITHTNAHNSSFSPFVFCHPFISKDIDTSPWSETLEPCRPRMLLGNMSSPTSLLRRRRL